MKAIIKKPGEKSKVIEIENELSVLQEAVEGYIQAVDPYRVKELVTGGTVHPKAMAVAGNYLIIGK